jgi:hypothetical protein
VRGKQPLLAAFAFRVGGFFLPPAITYRCTAYWEVVLPQLARMAGAAHTRGPLDDTGGTFPDLSFGSGMISFQFFAFLRVSRFASGRCEATSSPRTEYVTFSLVS